VPPIAAHVSSRKVGADAHTPADGAGVGRGVLGAGVGGRLGAADGAGDGARDGAGDGAADGKFMQQPQPALPHPSAVKEPPAATHAPEDA
jgi:hypothetical protein